MARLLETADALYEKHRNQIYSLIHKFARDGVADFEDLESLSNEVFTKCLNKWEPERGAFSTLLHVALFNAFRSELKKGKCRNKYEEQAAIEFDTTCQQTSGLVWLRDFLLAVDGDARKVISSILLNEIVPIKGKLNQADTKRTVIKTLSKKPSWTKARVARAFGDIKSALRAN